MRSGSPQVIVRNATTGLLLCPVCPCMHASVRYMQKHCKTHEASSPVVEAPAIPLTVSDDVSWVISFLRDHIQ
jgi:hypothetical protein